MEFSLSIKLKIIVSNRTDKNLKYIYLSVQYVKKIEKNKV